MSMSHTDAHPDVRLAGCCGVASGVLLLGTPALSAPEGITTTLWMLGWVLLLGFFAGIATLARGTDGRSAWLAPVISAASAVLVSVHLINVAVEYTANHLEKSSPAHGPLHGVGAAIFMLGILPFGLALVASAAVGLAGRVLPRWLAWAGLAVGVVALVNGTMVGSESAWGFLFGVVWMLTGGVVLAVRGPRTAVATVSDRPPSSVAAR